MRVRANRAARLLAVELAGGSRLRGIGIASLTDEDLRTVLGDDLSAWRRKGTRVGFTPNLIPNDFRGTNRPTYQQVLEFAPVGAGQ